jgi:hypothetical protein
MAARKKAKPPEPELAAWARESKTGHAVAKFPTQPDAEAALEGYPSEGDVRYERAGRVIHAYFKPSR